MLYTKDFEISQARYEPFILETSIGICARNLIRVYTSIYVLMEFI